jgi:NADH dehydrogenase
MVEQIIKGTPKKVVILGAGVAGLRIAKKLQDNLNHEWSLVLIDENDYHQYLYRIHEVCNVDYKEEDIIIPLKKLFNNEKVMFKQTTVTSIDPKRNEVNTTSGKETYDIVVITLGSHPAYYNIEGIREEGLTLGSYEQAIKIRETIQELFEKAGQQKNPPKIVIGGAGFSGVELAGELTDWLPTLYEKHNLSTPQTIVTVVEAFSSILPGWDKKLCNKGEQVLTEKGVDFIFNDPITKVGPYSVELKSGKSLEHDLFIWTGGVRGDPACGQDFETMRQKIVIDENCRALGNENVYVAGDSACTIDSDGRFQPPTAHIAMEQGDIVSHNILASINNRPLKKYEFKRAGEIVTLGRTGAVGELFGIHFTGLMAKFLKRVVHWWYLIQIGGLDVLLG